MCSIGALEFRSISKGIYVSDAIVKKSNVEIIYYKTICPGKFIVIVTGNEGEVDEAINYGKSIQKSTLLDSFKLHAVSKEIVNSFRNIYEQIDFIDAIGIVETMKVCTGIEKLDRVLKAGNVHLLKTYLAFAIGGKFVFIVTGTVSSIEYAFSSCKDLMNQQNNVNISIIPSPSKELLTHLFKHP